jgi:hypothetical protein
MIAAFGSGLLMARSGHERQNINLGPTCAEVRPSFRSET